MELALQMAKRGAASPFGIEAELAYGTLVHVPLNDGGSVFSDLVYVRSSRYLPVAVDAFVRALSEKSPSAKRAGDLLVPHSAAAALNVPPWMPLY